MTLHTYKMTHFGDPKFNKNKTPRLTRCIGTLRLHSKEGEWVGGFSSNKLDGSKIGSEKLIYLAKIAKKESLDVNFTLVFDEFYFFKENSLTIPPQIRQGVRVPKNMGYCKNQEPKDKVARLWILLGKIKHNARVLGMIKAFLAA